MKKIILFVLVAFLANCVKAQSYEWAKMVDASQSVGNAQRLRSIVVDEQKNVYTYGVFINTVDFDPGPATYNVTSNQSDCYILKLDSLGNFLWVKTFGHNADLYPTKITLGNNNSIFLSGSFYGTADFDPGIASVNVTSVGQNDLFLLKLDSSANFIWEKHFGNIGNNSITDIKVDQMDNVVACGYFSDVMDFDPGPGTFNDTAENFNVWSAFCLKLNSNGNFLWCNTVGIFGLGIDVDSAGNIYFTGEFSGIQDFDPSSTVFNLSELGSFSDIFIVKYNPNGNLTWAKSLIGSGTSDNASAIRYKNNQVFVIGNYSSPTQTPVDFDPGAGSYYMNSNGNTNGFVLKLTDQGNFVWAKQIYSTGNIEMKALDVDSMNRVYCTGLFQNNIDFNYGLPSSNLITTNWQPKFFILSIDNGLFNWGNVYLLNNSSNSIGYGLFVDKESSIYTIGVFQNTIDFNLGSGVNNLSSSANNSTFMLKLSQCMNINTTLQQSSCDSIVYNNQTYMNTGNYVIPFLSLNGCDSIIDLQVTITNLNASISQVGNLLNCNIANATYQWLNCTNGNQAITGATNQSYSPSINGSYAIIVTQNGCTDTSNCMTVNSVGLNNYSVNHLITISPNPTNSIFEIKGASYGAVVNLYNTFGQKLFTSKIENQTAFINISNFANGIYVTEIIEGNQTSRIKITKQ